MDSTGSAASSTTTGHPTRCSVVVVGAPGSGKTALIAAMARATGALPQPDSATTGISITRLTHSGIGLDVIDTPGERELVGGVRAGLRAGDGVVFVVSAVDGLDDATAVLWRECAADGRERVLAITDVDDDRADFDQTLAVCQRVLGEAGEESTEAPILAALVPLAGDDDEVAGLLDVVTLRVIDLSGAEAVERPADPEHVAAVANAREDLVHALVAVTDDEVLLDQVLGGSVADPDRLVDALHVAVALDAVNLAFPLASTSGTGVRQLLDLLTASLPLAPHRDSPVAQTLGGEPLGPWHGGPDDPLVAEVVSSRVMSGDAWGEHVVRVWAGSLSRVGTVQVVRPDDSRISTVLTPLADGEGLATVRLSPPASTGATISDGVFLRLAPWGLPEADVAVTVTGPAHLAEQLRAVVADDPVARLADARAEPAETADGVVLRCAGPVHADALLAVLAGRGVAAEWHPAPTSLRRTVRADASVSDATGVVLTVTPLPRGSGLEVDSPGLRAAVAGLTHPLIDARLELTGELASEAAGQLVERLLDAGGLVLLEPVDRVEVVVGDEYAAAVTEDIKRRRGRIVGTVPAGGARTRVAAVLPRDSLARYGLELRGVGHGTATWSREAAGHEPMPSYLAARLVSPIRPDASRTQLPMA